MDHYSGAQMGLVEQLSSQGAGGWIERGRLWLGLGSRRDYQCAEQPQPKGEDGRPTEPARTSSATGGRACFTARPKLE